MTDKNEAVARFKERWEFADDQGMDGFRVAYALEPLLAALEAAEAELTEARDGLYNIYIALGEDPDGARNAAQIFGPVATPPGKWVTQVAVEARAEYDREADRAGHAEAELTRRDTFIQDAEDTVRAAIQQADVDQLDGKEARALLREQVQEAFAAPPVSLEAAKAETTTEQCDGSCDSMFCTARPASTEGTKP